MTVLKMDGSRLVFARDSMPDLDTLQIYVGGYVQEVPRFNTFERKPCIALCDVDGKAKARPINKQATSAWYACLSPTQIADVLVGDVVVLTGDAEFLAAF
jgi:hypothetical protein